MAWWFVVIGLINTGLIAASVTARRSQNPRRRLRRVFVTCIALLFLVPAGGIGLGFFRAFAAVGGEDVDPSQKARLLGQGIAEAMNLTAFGVLSFLFPSIVALILFVRAPKETAPPAVV